jgi:hypothetical protein
VRDTARARRRAGWERRLVSKLKFNLKFSDVNRELEKAT